MPNTYRELIEKIIETSELIGNLKLSLKMESLRLKKIRDARKPEDQVDYYEDLVEENLKGGLALAEQNLADYKRDLVSICKKI